MTQKTVKDYIRSIYDFPHEGIIFRDVTTLFADARGFRMAVDQILHDYAGQKIDKVVGLEARGFILGGAVAHQLSQRHPPRPRAFARSPRVIPCAAPGRGVGNAGCGHFTDPS